MKSPWNNLNQHSKIPQNAQKGRAWSIFYSLISCTPYISRVDLLAEVGGELALFERIEVDGSKEQGDNSTNSSVDSENDFRPWKSIKMSLIPGGGTFFYLTVGFDEHPAKDGTTEATKTMVNTLKN